MPFPSAATTHPPHRLDPKEKDKEAERQHHDTGRNPAAASTNTKAGSWLSGSISSLWDRQIDGFTNFHRTENTSKNAKGPQHGVGYDPVHNHFVVKQITGPLRRKKHRLHTSAMGSGEGNAHADAGEPDRLHLYAGITRPEEYFSPEEERRWMESSQAARVLQFNEEALSTLTREELEARFCKLYKERQFSANAKEEVMVATEVLLEYLDSTTFTKKNRLYYHHFLDNARLSMDHELESARTAHQEWAMKLFGAAMLAAGVVVTLVAIIKGGWLQVEKGLDGSTIRKIGSTAAAYLTMSLFQPKNFEPRPDYSTRYLVTPSAMEVDEKRAAEAEATTKHAIGDLSDEEDDGEGERRALPPPSDTLHGWSAIKHVFLHPPHKKEDRPKETRSSSASSPTTAVVHGVWDTDAELQVRQEKAAQDEADAAALLRLYHAEKEWRKKYHVPSTTMAGTPAHERGDGGVDTATTHTLVGDPPAGPKGQIAPPLPRESPVHHKTTSDARRGFSLLPSTSFWEVSQSLARNFGGGSRLQRMMMATTEQEAMKEEMGRKLEERA